MSCLSDQTSTKDCKQTDHSMNKQCPLQNREARHSLIPDELWITLHLQNASLKFLTLKYISFSLPIIQTVGDSSKTFQDNCYGSWHHQNLRPTCPTHGHWHTVLLSCCRDGQKGCFWLAEAPCWHTVILNAKEAKPAAARSSKPAGLLTSLLCSRKHRTLDQKSGETLWNHSSCISFPEFHKSYSSFARVRFDHHSQGPGNQRSANF